MICSTQQMQHHKALQTGVFRPHSCHDSQSQRERNHLNHFEVYQTHFYQRIYQSLYQK